MKPRWGKGSSSELSNERCTTCDKPFRRWEYQNQCNSCLNTPPDRSDWLILQKRGAFKGHYITAVDGKEYYHEEWANNKVYKQYEDYEREERAPAMKLAQDSYKKLEQFKQKPKEMND